MKKWFENYWYGKKPFWNAFVIWGILIPLPVIFLQLIVFTEIFIRPDAYWVFNLKIIIFSWLVIIWPLFYQPIVLKILWSCRHNNKDQWPVAAAFLGYIYYAVSLLLTISGLLRYVLSDL